jgi:hypothetical protein
MNKKKLDKFIKDVEYKAKAQVNHYFDEPSLTKFRKASYWRGFWACFWLVVLPMVGLAVLVMSWFG